MVSREHWAPLFAQLLVPNPESCRGTVDTVGPLLTSSAKPLGVVAITLIIPAQLKDECDTWKHQAQSESDLQIMLYPTWYTFVLLKLKNSTWSHEVSVLFSGRDEDAAADDVDEDDAADTVDVDEDADAADDDEAEASLHPTPALALTPGAAGPQASREMPDLLSKETFN
ncbi:hypothetical protein WISP_34594 [Willisornis vidua]|uniref:Uncharacterized protein n=1 Tax=Willisornis vidua TaxID=1566151 RepID=A0ABQ9DJP1_9PASS|nr:hypothetical protein WISP_34594 [Willisornis vidua]